MEVPRVDGDATGGGISTSTLISSWSARVARTSRRARCRRRRSAVVGVDLGDHDAVAVLGRTCAPARSARRRSRRRGRRRWGSRGRPLPHRIHPLGCVATPTGVIESRGDGELAPLSSPSSIDVCHAAPLRGRCRRWGHPGRRRARRRHRRPARPTPGGISTRVRVGWSSRRSRSSMPLGCGCCSPRLQVATGMGDHRLHAASRSVVRLLEITGGRRACS